MKHGEVIKQETQETRRFRLRKFLEKNERVVRLADKRIESFIDGKVLRENGRKILTASELSCGQF